MQVPKDKLMDHVMNEYHAKTTVDPCRGAFESKVYSELICDDGDAQKTTSPLWSDDFETQVSYVAEMESVLCPFQSKVMLLMRNNTETNSKMVYKGAVSGWPVELSGSMSVNRTLPGDGGNDSMTTEVVGAGAVTVNVVFEASVVVDHALRLNDEDGAVKVSEYPGSVQGDRNEVGLRTRFRCCCPSWSPDDEG